MKDDYEIESQYHKIKERLAMQHVCLHCVKKFSAEKQKEEISEKEQVEDPSKEEQVTDLSEEEQLKALLEEEQEEEEEYQKSWKEIFLSKNVEMETLQCLAFAVALHKFENELCQKNKSHRIEKHRYNSQEIERMFPSIEEDESSDSFHDCFEESTNEYEIIDNSMATMEPIMIFDAGIDKEYVPSYIKKGKEEMLDSSTLSSSLGASSSPDILIVTGPRDDMKVDDFIPEIQEKVKSSGKARTGGKGCISLIFYTSIFAFFLVFMWIFIGGV